MISPHQHIMSVATRSVLMPPIPNREDLAATWNYLQAGIEKIMVDLENGLDMQTYMGVYT